MAAVGMGPRASDTRYRKKAAMDKPQKPHKPIKKMKKITSYLPIYQLFTSYLPAIYQLWTHYQS
jgi:hypothetical protein